MERRGAIDLQRPAVPARSDYVGGGGHRHARAASQLDLLVSPADGRWRRKEKRRRLLGLTGGAHLFVSGGNRTEFCVLVKL